MRMCMLLLLPAITAALRVHAPRMAAAAASASDICQALQDGSTPEGLNDLLSTRRSAVKFFDQYLIEDEWTCADAAAPPAALVESLGQAPLEVGEAILLNIVMGAATDADRKVARATSLINALWADGLAVQQSCEGLLDAVEFANGGEEIIIEDASGGNMELIRAQWGGILNMCAYDSEQFGKVRDALELCGDNKGRQSPSEVD